ncbi:MAG: NAD(P)H-dependent oxidoreductase [Kofleriaceae bacterium]|nr:NAD(P)H-dependent oxidoreductase [Kofleriaceae bacterium]
MTTRRKILVILGSTREGRYGDKPAHWILGMLRADGRFDAELVDLRDWPLPMFDQPRSPVKVTDGKYGNDVADRWGQTIAAADGYVIITAEYNHGYTAVLKNALDWIFREWNRKPVTFVGYGNAGGSRAIEQLREVAVELEMAPIRRAVHLPLDVYRATMTTQAPADPALFAPAEPAAKLMLDELAWWANALAVARAM